MTMATKSQLLTTSEFASRAGIAAAKVSKLIRDGIIKAEKKSGKWMISSGELKAVKGLSKQNKPSPKKKAPKAAPKKAAAAKKPAAPKIDKPAAAKPSAARTIPLADFVNMTYLTETGVRDWLRQGRLKGVQNDSGEWLIDAANLEVPDIKRLVR